MSKKTITIFALLFCFIICTPFSAYSTEGTELAAYSTKYGGGTVNRAINIKKAALEVNGTIILPGETFSFNFTVGPSTAARGFKIAKTFFKGKEVEGYGGGVCQVSSTIYCAALDAGLTVLERHPHSKKVHYVPENLDAATSYGGIDLKLRNDFPFPVAIFSYADKGTLKVSICSLE